jgi:hypothetical protein
MKNHETIEHIQKNTISVQYSESHCKIAEDGIESIILYFEKQTNAEKRALLFCLDRYLDPYYECKLLHEAKIFEWLESVLLESDNSEIKEDILQLLRDYSSH